MHESFLRYRHYRWLKISTGILVGAVVLYLRDPASDRRGGTPAGYALGTVSALLVLWLPWFGVRKRQYDARGPDLRGWLSAHVYLGGLLLLLVPLHAAFRFGPNLHTTSAMLLAAVIVSGLVGAVVYTVVPDRMTRNRSGQKLDALLEQIADVDAECNLLAATLPTPVAGAVAANIAETRIGGGLVVQLTGYLARCPTTEALRVVRVHSEEATDGARELRERLARLLERLVVKRTVLARIRRDVQLKALLDVWLVLHVPLAIATVVAVAAHVFVVLFYYR